MYFFNGNFNFEIIVDHFMKLQELTKDDSVLPSARSPQR